MTNEVNHTAEINTAEISSAEMEARYERAKCLMQGYFKRGTGALVSNPTLFPIWIENSNRFWYERDLKGGKEFRLVNAETATNAPAFNHEALATALAEATGETVKAKQLPINDLVNSVGKLTDLMTMKLSPRQLTFTAFERR